MKPKNIRTRKITFWVVWGLMYPFVLAYLMLKDAINFRYYHPRHQETINLIEQSVRDHFFPRK